MTPLQDLKVLDLTRVLAGPNATQMLADFGATIWKVEALYGDEARTWGEAAFAQFNRGKMSIAVNIAEPRGQELIRQLARKADVFTENFKVGNLARFGLGADDLLAINPRLICASITGFGQTGPRSRLPGYDMIAQAYSGMMSLTGERDGGPLRLGVPLVDLMTGHYATLGILFAILHRNQTGKGQKIDVSLYDVALSANASASSYLNGGYVTRRYGAAHSSFAPCQLYAAAGGPVMIAIGNDLQFRRLCEAIGLAHLADDPKFATNADRVANKAELNALLEPVFARTPRDELIALLEDGQVPVGPVYDIDEVYDDPQAVARGAVQDDDGAAVRVLANPLRFMTDSPPRRHSFVPRRGEHTRTLLREQLGMPEAEIDGLIRDKVLFDGE